MSSKLVIKEVPVTTFKKEVTGVDLTLSLEEAMMLSVLVGNVGGSFTNSAREYSQSISTKLEILGIYAVGELECEYVLNTDTHFAKEGSSKFIHQMVEKFKKRVGK